MRSFINKLKRSGPLIEPGMPTITIVYCMTTFCFLYFNSLYNKFKALVENHMLLVLLKEGRGL